MQATDDNMDWTQQSGPTPSSSTGPSADHTSGNGKYVYIETADPVELGDYAVLKSGTGPSTRGSCLNFW